MVQRVQYRFKALQDCFQHLEKRQSTRRSKTFPCVGNNPVTLKKSTEHAEPLFSALAVKLRVCSKNEIVQ